MERQSQKHFRVIRSSQKIFSKVFLSLYLQKNKMEAHEKTDQQLQKLYFLCRDVKIILKSAYCWGFSKCLQLIQIFR